MAQPVAEAQLQPQQRYLESLTAAIREVVQQVEAGADMSVHRFTELCDKILHAFDHLGAFMWFAKAEMTNKNESLKKAAATLPTLRDVVAHDKAAGRVAVKNSYTRNLHRLMLVVSFVQQMLDHLLSNPKMLLKDAFYKAYMGSLAPIHTYILQTAVWAALGWLPTKEQFLKSIGETEATAKQPAGDVVTGAKQVVTEVEKLLDGCKIPASDVTFVPTTPAPTAVTS